MSNRELGRKLFQLLECFQERAQNPGLNIMLLTGELDMAKKLVEAIAHIQARDIF